MEQKNSSEREYKKSRLERVQEKIYSVDLARNEPRSVLHKTIPHRDTESVESFVATPEAPYEVPPKKTGFSHFSLFMFWSSLVSFVVVVLFASYHFYFGANDISKETIDFSISGPSVVEGGESFPLDIIVANRNKVELRLVDAVVEYPRGEALDTQEDMVTTRLSIGNVSSGAFKKTPTDIVLFGKEGSIRTVRARLEFTVPGSSAIFTKETTYEVRLQSSPVIITTQQSDKVTSNEQMEYTVEVKALRGTTLENFLVNIEYPSGFQFVSAEPAPTFPNTTWRFDTIEKGKTKKIVVKGVLRGEQSDEKVFRVTGGAADTNNNKKIGVVYAETKSSVLIEKAFISLDTRFDAKELSDGAFLARQGDTIRGTINYENNIGSIISDIVVSAKLEGDLVNRGRVIVENGYFDSRTNTCVWDRSGVVAFRGLAPNQKGALRFTIVSYDAAKDLKRVIKNPSISVTASVKGVRLSDSNFSEDSLSSLPVFIKFPTDITLTSIVDRRDSLFKVIGNIPPQVDKTTSYNITLSAASAINKLENGKVTMRLPYSVAYKELSYPSSESLVYDARERALVWSIGDIPARLGREGVERSVTFQVELTPSITQQETVPTLVSDIALSGRDAHTGEAISKEFGDLSTKDADLGDGNETVSD